MSKLVLFGPTALEFYNRCTSLPNPSLLRTLASDAYLAPTTAGLKRLENRFPFLTQPFHVTVFGDHERRQRLARCHIASTSVRQSRFFAIDDGMFVPPPELALIQASRGVALPLIAQRGTALCGTFALTDDAHHLAHRPPLASPGSIERAGRRHRDVSGCSNTRSAVPWMLADAASPRESALALILSLPTHHGGYGLLHPLLNRRIDLSAKGKALTAKGYYVADLCWPAHRLIVEYDSDEFHLTSQQHYHDAVKRTTLGEMGYRVVTVTRQQLNSFQETEKVAAVIARALDRPLRIRTQNFRSRQISLWRTLGLPCP